MDDLDVRQQALEDPEGLVRWAPRVVVDEVQRAPDVLLAIKAAVDAEGPAGRPVRLTGSANLLLMKQISESLAGRAVYLNLWPLTRGELDGEGRAGRWSRLFEWSFDDWPDALDGSAPGEVWQERARVGGYPVPAHQLDDAEARASGSAGTRRPTSSGISRSFRRSRTCRTSGGSCASRRCGWVGSRTSRTWRATR